MDQTNIYYISRMLGAMGDPVYTSRAGAATRLPCSKEALADYESGKTVPPCSVVAAMVVAYKSPELRDKHITATCPLIAKYGNEGRSELAEAALNWVVAMGSAEEIGRQFAEVAQDGQIDGAERTAAEVIRRKAQDIMHVMEVTITAIDSALAR